MSSRFIIAAAVVLGLSCSNPAQQPAAPHVEKKQPAASPMQVSEMGIRNVTITPSPVRKNDPATVHVDFLAARPGVPLRLSWFGPDGWLTHDSIEWLGNGSATFTAPAGSFDEPGRYHYELASGSVHLAEGDVEVVQ